VTHLLDNEAEGRFNQVIFFSELSSSDELRNKAPEVMSPKEMETTQMPHFNDILIMQYIWLHRPHTPILQNIAIYGMPTLNKCYWRELINDHAATLRERQHLPDRMIRRAV
jgi:hypothetical protein